MSAQNQANIGDGVGTSGYMQTVPQSPCPTCGYCPTCGRRNYQQHQDPYWHQAYDGIPMNQMAQGSACAH